MLCAILTCNNAFTFSGVDPYSQFSWSDGTSSTYNSFSYPYDQDTGPRCVDAAMYQGNTWDATPCRDNKNWVCKRSAAAGMLSMKAPQLRKILLPSFHIF